MTGISMPPGQKRSVLFYTQPILHETAPPEKKILNDCRAKY